MTQEEKLKKLVDYVNALVKQHNALEERVEEMEQRIWANFDRVDKQLAEGSDAVRREMR